MPDDTYGDLRLNDGGPLVVGVGASAGGLEAFQSLLASLPPKHSLALILVQHLDPDHESLLPELLAKRTETPVATAEDGTKVEPGHIYLIPPGAFMTIDEGRLRLTKMSTPRGLRRPIDKFFESLASDVGPRGVAIVLSGTGSDGSIGIRAVKEAGGLVFVQDPSQAEYNGMPNSAIETGADDIVLPTQDMYDVISDYFSIRSDLKPSVLSDAEFLQRVAKHIRYRTGHDFGQYKHATFLRRIAVRMSVLGLSEPNAYLKELISNKSEAAKLFRDLLINVTSFFRDPPAFDSLQTEVIRKIVQNKGASDEIRVWVPGCSTGQEAFSIAMLIAEELERTDGDAQVAIFATDIDEDALRMARKGHFPNSIIDEVPEALLARYFTVTPDGYEATPKLREMVRFSNQSIIKDPPFSRIDLVSCRNVTIYFDNELQDFAITVFHYALKEGGYLFLGPSETPRIIDDLFITVDQRNRIFQRRQGPSRRLNFPIQNTTAVVAPDMTAELEAETLYRDPLAHPLISRFSPPFVLTDGSGRLHYTSDRASKYLRIKPGSTRMVITQLIIPELESSLRRLIVKADGGSDVKEVEYRGEIDGQEVRIVLGLAQLEDGSRLIVIDDRLDAHADRPIVMQRQSADTGDYVQELELELERARETIRTTIEELETSNEELKSSNEEMMSMNEELQSANEELSTTNEELQVKIAELRDANQDMANLMRSTRIITIFLDDELRLRFFTPESRNAFRFVDSDRGRRIDDIGSDVDMVMLTRMCRQVLESKVPIEEEISSVGGEKQFLLDIEPYTGEGGPTRGGVVCTMTDVTALRRALHTAESERSSSQRRLAEIEQLYYVSPQAMALLGTDGTYLRINQRMAEINGLGVDSHVGRHMRDVVPDLAAQVDDAFGIVMETGSPVLARRMEGRTPASGSERRLFLTDWYPVQNKGETVAVGVNFRDITEQTEMSAELKRVMQELQHRVKNMLANVLALVSRARRDATTDMAVLDTLASRINALAHTHKVLTEENWRAADIYALIGPETRDIYGEDRVSLKGPPLKMNARACLAIGMAIHELATNAAKYGAFSTDAGRVSLHWFRLDDGNDDKVVFTWTESDGPPVPKRERSGFGSQLIASTITGSLHGDVVFDWQESGLKVTLSVPYEELNVVNEDVVYDFL
ncbi:PAS domain-containing protein [Alphaproteobacteria bacterium GH1-50]|uniref:PAS domain-containing protein n=1 Tax=Kangsaoukella pontilimi TaxID=2691042 RepID=A0A7C9IDW3_9RHOB|nr:chemotaxis protein CheB [Kangsaoukella pontilimi]MXQ06308.1 PAS domain-containing protein [Kangsaoukella pontilimi]